MKTAVEEFFNELVSLGFIEYPDDSLIQNRLLDAKEKEKKQIIDFAFNFYYDMSRKMGVEENLISENRTNAEQYYTETFNPS